MNDSKSMARELTALQAELAVLQATGIQVQRRLSLLLGEQPIEPRPKQPVPCRVTEAEVKKTGRRGYELFGEYSPQKNAQETMVAILTTFADLDNGFPEKLQRHILPTTNRRPFVARSRLALYPDSPHLVRASREFAPGWWVATNESNERKEQLLRRACNMLHLTYGSDLRVWF